MFLICFYYSYLKIHEHDLFLFNKHPKFNFGHNLCIYMNNNDLSYYLFLCNLLILFETFNVNYFFIILLYFTHTILSITMILAQFYPIICIIIYEC